MSNSTVVVEIAHESGEFPELRESEWIIGVMSPLRNPYRVGRDGEASKVAALYARHIRTQLLNASSPVARTISVMRTYLFARRGLVLLCSCGRSKECCPGVVIKGVLLNGRCV